VKNNAFTTIKQGENSNKQNVAEEVFLRLVPHSQKELAKTTQARSNGAAD
jgi:hypothetical protein